VVVSAVLAALLITAGVAAALSIDDPGTASSSGPDPTPVQTEPQDPLDGIELDALQSARIGELLEFVDWLDENGAQDYIGELGWSRTDPEWQELADYWYRVADAEGLWTTAWAAGSTWSDDYALTIYHAESRAVGLSTFYAPARVLEVEGRVERHGVNLAGLEFGKQAESFSAQEPGLLGQDYFDEPAASFAYLAGRGIDLVRLPFRWERLQPEPGGALDADYVRTIEDMLDAAAEQGIDVVLDLHNYGVFETSDGTLRLGSGELPRDALTDVWLRMSARWSDHPAVLAYGLMNEPHSLGDGSTRESAVQWELTTQSTLDALRAAGDTTLLMIPGYDWSSLRRWSENHPVGWISDPANNFRYEAHPYWDDIGEGAYALPYADERAMLAD